MGKASPPFDKASPLLNRPFLQQPPFPYNNPLLFVIPSAAEGSAVQRTFPGNVFVQSVTARALFTTHPAVTARQP
jgi:hypothetical protein